MLRRLIACNRDGWAHASVELNAGTETVEAFLDIVTTGEVALQWTSAGAAIASVARLADFLGHYQCEAAGNILAKHLKEQAGSVLPPITLLVAAIGLKRPELTQFMLMRNDVPEPQLWCLPNITHAGGMPYVPFEVYRLIPVEYQWALRMAGIQNGGSPRGTYARFCEYLQQAQKESKAKTVEPGAGEESEWDEF